MSRLLEEIRKDPDAVFEYEATLPSGNVMSGTVGPLVGNALVTRVVFAQNPASDEDVATAKRIFDEVMGQPADFVNVSSDDQGHEAAIAAVRRFLGGGRG